MIYISVKETADLLGFHERTIRSKVERGEIKARKLDGSVGRGGKKIEILLESLSEQAQVAYHNKNGESLPVINTELAYTTNKQKEYGDIRSRCIREFKGFEKECIKNGITKKGTIRALFMEKWNIENPHFKRSSKALYDWMKKSKSGKSEKLVDKRGGYNRGKTAISNPLKEYFLSLYLTQSKPTFESCYRFTQIEANKRGEQCHSQNAFRNILNNMNPAIITLYREGKKAFEDNCMPTTQRDYSHLLPNDMWVADHHLWDVFVRVPDGKGGWKPVRPWGSYWMDMRTRKVMAGFIREESPNSDVVLLSFGIAVEKYGVPKSVYLDNGKDYKARDLFYPEGHKSKQDTLNKKILTDGIPENELENARHSLASHLDLEVTYAIPYNARAKPIERMFGTFEDNFGKLYPSYAGSNAKNRPEDLKDLDIMNMITLDEFIEHHNTFVNEIYASSPHNGNDMDNKSPDYWYNHLEFTMRTMSSEVLYFTLMRTARPRVVQKEGIKFNKEWYLNAEYQNYWDKKVLVRYNPTKPEIIYVFDMNENFLFTAGRRKKYGFELTDADYEEANKEKKIARNAALNGYKPNDSIRSTEAIGERLNDYANSLEQIEVSTPKVVEPIRNDKMEESVRRYHASALDKNYEDVLKANEKVKKDSNDKQKQLIDNFRKKMLDRAEATAKQA